MPEIPDPKPDHVAGNFDWLVAPNCTCGLLAKAIDEHAIFVSNMTNGDFNICYVFLMTANGELHRDDGTPIEYCPW